jgi:hypothetical protein
MDSLNKCLTLPSQRLHVLVCGLETSKHADLLLLYRRLYQHPPLSQAQQDLISVFCIIPIALLALRRVLVVVDEVVDRRVSFLESRHQPPHSKPPSQGCTHYSL